MDEEQNTSQESNEQGSEQPTPEQQAPPTQPQTDFSPPEEPESKSKKKIVIAILFVLLLIAIAAGAWYFIIKDDVVEEQAPAQTSEQPAQEAEKEEVEAEPEVYVSTLYPDFSFTVPVGWEVNEPAEYDEGEWGPGSAAGVIAVTNGDTTLNLEMLTIYATGFEGYSCYNVDNLTAVGDYYRYTDSEGLTVFRNGLTESDELWEETIADPDFTTIEDPDPNFCMSFPYIGTYSSTLNQADYDLPYGFNEFEKVLVWLDATVTGPVDEATLADIDSIILSKSVSVDTR